MKFENQVSYNDEIYMKKTVDIVGSGIESKEADTAWRTSAL